jgi:GTP cyclohydrolase I
VVVVMDAEHLCMAMRGAKMLGVKTRTTVTLGVFADHDRTAKAEFLSAIGQVNGV